MFKQVVNNKTNLIIKTAIQILISLIQNIVINRLLKSTWEFKIIKIINLKKIGYTATILL